MKVLDTTFLIDLVSGKKETLKLLEKNEVLLTTQISMFEFTRGLFLRDVSSSKILNIMELFDNLRTLQLNDDGIIKAAEISSDLIKEGKEIDDSDCLIAGTILGNGFNKIITRNTKHFERIKGLEVIKY